VSSVLLFLSCRVEVKGIINLLARETRVLEEDIVY